MKNRHSLSPILWVLVVSLIVTPRGLRAADTDSTNAPPSPPPASENAPPATPAPASAPAPVAAENPATYTVVSGDTLWDLSHKFHCSVRQLKKLNNLKTTHLKLGQVLKIPPAKTETPAATPPVKSTSLKPKPKVKESETAFHYRHAEPVQDFDIPASTFASCPVPVPASDADDSDTSSSASAPLATDDTSRRAVPVALPAAPDAYYHPIQASPQTARSTQKAPAPSTFDTSEFSASPVKPPRPGFFGLFNSAPAEVDWGTRFTQVARDLGDRGLAYDEDWCPPGESTSWTMDCSNTTRYLYKVTAGIQLPRTASDQYYYLHLQNKAWDVPQLANGFADCNYLRQNLRPGDLLFWENTYKPERQPPITHVMVFLGTNARGEWIMAGSQTSRGGEHNRRDGGPDIYVFDPTKPCGGYSTWMGLVHHQGRFCAYGRPLEADRNKLAVAAND
jgi:LysM repeat protein/cell wall-associated NlpC family hydrolase